MCCIQGITYDTGGADIKAGGNMAGMHRDKCGAATVAGFMKVKTSQVIKEIDLYQVPQAPEVYNQAINNNLDVHQRRRLEEEHNKMQELWAICKGFLKGCLDNIHDTLDKTYYKQLQNRVTAYKTIATQDYLDHLKRKMMQVEDSHYP